MGTLGERYRSHLIDHDFIDGEWLAVVLLCREWVHAAVCPDESEGPIMHDDHFIPVTDAEALDALFAASTEQPVILFKHDPYCPISARAYREMEHVAGDVAIIDVAHDDVVKRAIATRTGIRHESPQVIVVRDGKAVWSASQFRITANDVAKAVNDKVTGKP